MIKSKVLRKLREGSFVKVAGRQPCYRSVAHRGNRPYRIRRGLVRYRAPRVRFDKIDPISLACREWSGLDGSHFAKPDTTVRWERWSLARWLDGPALLQRRRGKAMGWLGSLSASRKARTGRCGRQCDRRSELGDARPSSDRSGSIRMYVVERCRSYFPN